MLRAIGITIFAGLFAITLGAQPPGQVSAGGQGGGRGRTQQPSRDTSAQTNQPVPTGRITGRVVAADTGRPLKRARVLVNAAELPGGRGALTDDTGAFDFTELPAGRYNVSVSKSGFVTLSYG